MRNSMVLLLGFLLVSMAGCSSMQPHEDYGKSTEYNKLVQTYDLNAPMRDHPDVVMDGQKAADAVTRYRGASHKAETNELVK